MTEPTSNQWSDIKVGDEVIRMLGVPAIPLPLRVTQITEQLIHCGDWQFDRITGAEVDELLGWGPPPKVTGSYIKRVE